MILLLAQSIIDEIEKKNSRPLEKERQKDRVMIEFIRKKPK